jgi:hypothetical protein
MISAAAAFWRAAMILFAAIANRAKPDVAGDQHPAAVHRLAARRC